MLLFLLLSLLLLQLFFLLLLLLILFAVPFSGHAAYSKRYASMGELLIFTIFGFWGLGRFGLPVLATIVAIVVAVVLVAF